MVEMSDIKLIRQIANAIDELEPILNSLVVNDTTVIDALAQLLSALHQMQLRSEEHQKKVAGEVDSFTRQLTKIAGSLRVHQPIIITANEQFAENSEFSLLEYLYSFLTDTNAIDVGANVGKLSERLLKVGYTVYAFEPYGPVFKTLQKLSAAKQFNDKFHAFEFAVGSTDKTMDLHIAADLSSSNKWDSTLFNSLVKHPMLESCQFTQTVRVQVRSLESLEKEGKIPLNCGILKIDTEGFDLDVIKGMGNGQYTIVMAEFWDAEHPFGRAGNGKLEELVAEMKTRGYAWHLVIYHVDQTATVSYYCNRLQQVPQSWGNVLFFQDHGLFATAMTWCEDVLTPTLFR
jgi:FkbM family methyltransferase